MSRRKTKRTSTLKEKDLDDIFIKELCYVRMQTEIKEHLLKKEENKRIAFKWVSIKRLVSLLIFHYFLHCYVGEYVVVTCPSEKGMNIKKHYQSCDLIN